MVPVTLSQHQHPVSHHHLHCQLRYCAVGATVVAVAISNFISYGGGIYVKWWHYVGSG